MSFTARTCTDRLDFRKSASVQDGKCYDLLDRAVWKSLISERFPEELDDPAISLVRGEFCSTNMCNIVSVCGAKNARSLPLFGNEDVLILFLTPQPPLLPPAPTPTYTLNERKLKQNTRLKHSFKTRDTVKVCMR